MATSHHHHHHLRRTKLVFATVTTLAFLLLASVSTFRVNPSRQLSVGVRRIKDEEVERVQARRQLGGPGSYPPTCISKCGGCTPCRPVHVPIQPGFSIKLEYYPEAWRCKCRNKLFMP